MGQLWGISSHGMTAALRGRGRECVCSAMADEWIQSSTKLSQQSQRPAAHQEQSLIECRPHVSFLSYNHVQPPHTTYSGAVCNDVTTSPTPPRARLLMQARSPRQRRTNRAAAILHFAAIALPQERGADKRLSRTCLEVRR